MGNIHILKPPFPMDNILRCLTTRKPSRNLPMLFLTTLTTSRGLSFPRGRAATSTNSLVVGARVVGDGGEDVCGAGVELGEERWGVGWFGEELV